MTPEKRQPRTFAERRRANRKAARALENYGRSVRGLPPQPDPNVVLGLALANCLVMVARLALVAFIAYWAITDVMAVGWNFWNIFWLALAVLILLARSTTTTSKD